MPCLSLSSVAHIWLTPCPASSSELPIEEHAAFDIKLTLGRAVPVEDEDGCAILLSVTNHLPCVSL